MFTFGMFNSMKRPPEDGRHILFSVKADKNTFPADVWERFRDTTKARKEYWVTVLRRLMEEYTKQEPKP
jgi:hypothetical protein